MSRIPFSSFEPKYPAPSLSAVFPDLGDTFGGAFLSLTVTSRVTRVTIGGTPCTSVHQSGIHVTCLAPAKAPGLYDVVVSGPGGTSAPLIAAYEAWSPLDVWPAARLYQSDQSVASGGDAVRRLGGLWCSNIVVGGASEPCDGQGFVALANGNLLLLGGAPGGHAVDRVNTVWLSHTQGRTWNILLPNDPLATDRPAQGHSFASFTMTIAGTEFVYWIGGDPFVPNGDVWRSADGGSTWTRISTSCPTSGLALYNYGVLDGVIYIMGGQTDIMDPNSGSNVVYRSTDFGVTWTSMGAAPWPGRGAQVGPMPVKDGLLWLVAGATYDGADIVHNFYNDVWTFDGSTWTNVLADGNGQIPKCRYHSVVLDSFGFLWRINGTTWDGATETQDTRRVDYSSDGVAWTQAPNSAIDSNSLVPWPATHAQAAVVVGNDLLITNGFATPNLYVIQTFEAPMVSTWTDLGSDHLDLSQSTDDAKPVVQPRLMRGQPGLVFAATQHLDLVAPDRDRTDGHFEAWFVGQTLNFATNATSGPNSPATVICSLNPSVWNGFGFTSDQLQYNEASGGFQHHIEGNGFNDGLCRAYGVYHSDNDIRLFAGSVRQGPIITGFSFNTTFTGWDTLGIGFTDTNGAQIVVGAVLVLPNGAATDDTTRSKLARWAMKWGSVAQ